MASAFCQTGPSRSGALQSCLRRRRHRPAAAAGATGIGLALAPSGSLATPGPLSAPHTKANLACAKCHGRAESTSPTARIEELTTLSCIGCHGAHELRRGHKGALEQGKLGCATCHPAHASETVTFLGNGKARHATPTGTSEVAAPPIAKGVTVPILRADRCVGCHDAARRGDPLAPCVDASGRTSPPLVVRCFAEHAEILVLREDGSPCGPNEPGELVHRGALVGQGYWNDADKTAEGYKLLAPGSPGRPAGLQLPEYAVFSGDTVRMDEEGFLYFIGRRDEMMKTSGYRVSPTDVEEVLYATRLVGECAAFGVDHPALGQALQVIATPPEGRAADAALVAEVLAQCRLHMPAYMVPAGIEFVAGPLPRNPNGNIDRKSLSQAWIQGRS